MPERVFLCAAPCGIPRLTGVFIGIAPVLGAGNGLYIPHRINKIIFFVTQECELKWKNTVIYSVRGGISTARLFFKRTRNNIYNAKKDRYNANITKKKCDSKTFWTM